MRNNKKKGTNNVHQEKKDDFNVRDNLRKLNKYGKNNDSSLGYEYADYLNNSNDVVASNGYTNGFEHQTTQELKILHTKLITDISDIKEKVYKTRGSLSDKINHDIDCVKKDFEKKLDSKIEGTYFWGAVGVITALTLIIFSLSYSPMINKVESIEKENIKINDSIKSIRFDLKNKKR